jgi:hypothetical protein
MQTKTKTLTPEKAAKELAEKKEFEKDLKRAEELMNAFAEFKKEEAEIKAALEADVKTFVDSANEKLAPIMVSAKEAEKELIALGEKHKKKFINNKLEFEDGYLLKSFETVVETGKEFNMSKFIKAFPDLVNTDWNIKGMKPLFLDADARKKLVKHDIDLKENDSIKVKLNKKKVTE